MDHVDGGGVLDVTDGVDGTLTPEIHTLADQPSWTVDVTAQVEADLAAGRTTSTFRVRFSVDTNNNGQEDGYRIGSSKNPFRATHPVLVITP